MASTENQRDALANEVQLALSDRVCIGGERGHFFKFFKAFCNLCVYCLDEEWAKTTSKAYKQLKQDLNACTNLSECVSFGDADARKEYIRNFLSKRSGNLGFLMVTSLCNAVEATRELLLSTEDIRILSVGGGPGLLAVGVSAFLLHEHFLPASSARKRAPPSVGHCEIICADYEDGWRVELECVARTVARAIDLVCEAIRQPRPFNTPTLSFAHCDVRNGLKTDQNRELAAILTGTGTGTLDAVIFSFVVVENLLALRASEWQFVTDVLCALSPRGTRAAVALFMDSTHRPFLELLGVCEACGLTGAVPGDIDSSPGVPRNVLLAVKGAAVCGNADPNNVIRHARAEWQAHNAAHERWRELAAAPSPASPSGSGTSSDAVEWPEW